MKRVLPATAFALLLSWATLVWAEATVHVQVRPPADGTVTLVSGGRTFTCRTAQGACTLTGVPGGPATATFTPQGGTPTAPRPVMIGPNGNVSLILPTGR